MPLAYLTRIAQTPAPTFQEGARAALMAALWQELGYATETDAVGNVLTRMTPPGTEGRPALLLASHLDTVFEHGWIYTGTESSPVFGGIAVAATYTIGTLLGVSGI